MMDDPVESLIKAREEGRNIVPLVGAGISVSSGIPAISGLIRYLAKVQFYLDHEAYLPSHEQPDPGRPAIRPEVYLEALGWPDPYQLDEDLWQFLEERLRGAELEPSDDLMEQVVQITLRRELREHEPELVKALDEEADLPLRRRLEGGEAPDPQVESRDGWRGRKLAGNWRTLLNFVTRSDPGQVDSLFRRLTRDRIPGAAHHFLALVARLMDWKLALTMNFDTLIEEAMREEGLRPDVYEVSSDAGLPDPTLLRQRLSVVKLHGGMYGLTVGDRLDQPMHEESKSRIRRALPESPLILVLGWGG